MNWKLLVFILPIAFIIGCTQLAAIDSFQKCADAGNPVTESYPRVCSTPDGRTFTEQLAGNDRDEHGCIGSAGYSWCAAKGKCLRIWEEPCPMTYAEAYAHALNSSCTENGTLTNTHMYNDNSKTWWIDLNLTKPGCSPACVVDENGTAEINWRCTGLILP